MNIFKTISYLILILTIPQNYSVDIESKKK